MSSRPKWKLTPYSFIPLSPFPSHRPARRGSTLPLGASAKARTAGRTQTVLSDPGSCACPRRPHWAHSQNWEHDFITNICANMNLCHRIMLNKWGLSSHPLLSLIENSHAANSPAVFCRHLLESWTQDAVRVFSYSYNCFQISFFRNL